MAGRTEEVYVFLRLLSDTYEQYFRRANDNGHLRTMAPLDQDAILHVRDEFFRLFPRDIIYRGGREDLHRWYIRASTAVDDDYSHISIIHPIARAAFDTTFALLVRTIRSFPLPRRPDARPWRPSPFMSSHHCPDRTIFFFTPLPLSFLYEEDRRPRIRSR